MLVSAGLTSLSVSFWVTEIAVPAASGVVRVTDQTPFVTGRVTAAWLPIFTVTVEPLTPVPATTRSSVSTRLMLGLAEVARWTVNSLAAMMSFEPSG